MEREKNMLSGAKVDAKGLDRRDQEIRCKRNVLYQLYAMHARNQRERAIKQSTKLDGKVKEKCTICAEAVS